MTSTSNFSFFVVSSMRVFSKLHKHFIFKSSCVPFQETMGIYGRVCGPATTTVQLFEEETCMMDDNATPAK